MDPCPACGQPIESSAACPACGLPVPNRMPIRWMRLACVPLAIIGLALLYRLPAAEPTTPLRELAGFPPLARARVSGIVSSSPILDPSDHSLAFQIDDGSGTTPVLVDRATVDELGRLDRLPALGDRVTLGAVFHFADEVPTLRLASGRDLTLDRPTPAEKWIAAITPDDHLAAVTVSGRVRGIQQPFDDLRLVTLADGTGSLTLRLELARLGLTGPLPEFAAGDEIRATGAVTFVEGRPHLTLPSAQAMRVSPAPLVALPSPPPPSPTSPSPTAAAASTPLPREGVNAVAEVRPGDSATLQGEVSSVESYSGGFKFRLDDGSGQIVLLLAEPIYAGLANPDTLRQGAVVRAGGQVKLYRGELELVPSAAAQVSILVPGRPSADPPTPIAEIGLGSLSRVMTVEGQITANERFSRGVRLSVDDGSGTIVVLLWQNVFNFVPNREALEPGQRARVTGLVQEYRGAMEVVPQLGFDVAVELDR